MEEKKKRRKKKKEETQLLLFLLLGLAVVVLLFLLICTKLLPHKVNFEMSERASKVEASDIRYNDYIFDAVGWIRVQGTNIDYPVVINENNVDYPVQVDKYAWLSNFEPSFGNHMIVSGHNVFNLGKNIERENELFTRFEELMNFAYYDFAKENQYIQLTFDGQEYIYKIFGVGFIPVAETGQFSLTYGFDENDAEKFLNNFEQYNLYDYKIDVNKEDKLISLVTCTRFFSENEEHQFRIIGRLLREGEKIDSYSVIKTKKYEEIEKILKGDEEKDEEI